MPTPHPPTPPRLEPPWRLVGAVWWQRGRLVEMERSPLENLHETKTKNAIARVVYPKTFPPKSALC